MGGSAEEEEKRGRKAPERVRLQKIQSPVPSPLSTPLDAQSHFTALRSCSQSLQFASNGKFNTSVESVYSQCFLRSEIDSFFPDRNRICRCKRVHLTCFSPLETPARRLSYSLSLIIQILPSLGLQQLLCHSPACGIRTWAQGQSGRLISGGWINARCCKIEELRIRLCRPMSCWSAGYSCSCATRDDLRRPKSCDGSHFPRNRHPSLSRSSSQASIRLSIFPRHELCGLTMAFGFRRMAAVCERLHLESPELSESGSRKALG